MKCFVCSLFLILILIFSATFCYAQSSTVNKVILQVEEKNPRHAKAVTLWPIFGPIAGANYAGFSPDSIEIPSSLRKTARSYVLINTGEILGGGLLGYFVGQGLEEEDTKTTTYADGREKIEKERNETGRWIGLGAGAGIGIIAAIITNTRAGTKYAEYCVKYNKKLYEKFEWQPPVVGMGQNGETYIRVALKF